MNEQVVKPPIGIIPELHWRYQRIIDLDACIERYVEFKPDDELLPIWKNERVEHEKWIQNNKYEFWITHFLHTEDKI